MGFHPREVEGEIWKFSGYMPYSIENVSVGGVPHVAGDIAFEPPIDPLQGRLTIETSLELTRQELSQGALDSF